MDFGLKRIPGGHLLSATRRAVGHPERPLRGDDVVGSDLHVCRNGNRELGIPAGRRTGIEVNPGILIATLFDRRSRRRRGENLRLLAWLSVREGHGRPGAAVCQEFRELFL